MRLAMRRSRTAMILRVEREAIAARWSAISCAVSISRRLGVVLRVAKNSVSTFAGWIVDTLILCFRKSHLIERLNPVTPCFEAQYAA